LKLVSQEKAEVRLIAVAQLIKIEGRSWGNNQTPFEKRWKKDGRGVQRVREKNFKEGKKEPFPARLEQIAYKERKEKKTKKEMERTAIVRHSRGRCPRKK